MAVEWTEQMIETDAGTVRARLYRAALTPRNAPLVLFLHGGAFIGGSLDDGDALARVFAEAGAIVLSADYPLAPAAPFPKPLIASFKVLQSMNDCRAKWSNKKADIYVAGAEAGGNLAASLALMARDQQTPRLAGQILISPLLDPCLATKSMREADVGPVGCPIADGWHQYLGTPDKACHPYAAPLGASRLAGLADALMVTAENDPLRDEAAAYADRLRAASVQVDLLVLPADAGWPGPGACPGRLNSALAAHLRERFVGFFTKRTSSDRGSGPFPVKMAEKAGSQTQ
jgi:acetyl esterase/lipase